MEYIEGGRFVLPYCNKCRKTIWPPADNCRLCLNNLSLKDYRNKEGKKVRMKKCGFINQKIFYRFEIVNN